MKSNYPLSKKPKLSESPTVDSIEKPSFDPKSYTYINRNLSDLKSPLIDIHDNAWFAHTYPLNIKFKYTNYNIAYLNPNDQTSIAAQNDLISSLQVDYMPEIFEQSDITLNHWFRTISDLVIQFHKASYIASQVNTNDESPNKSNNTNICYKLNQNDKKNVNRLEPCQCISTLNATNLSRSYLVQFFVI